ncbi:DUF6223 family protein [Dactylosporangium matsuzakiense]|uniref:Uncharacterized protein n=1 Tax=Dactylosporangium matsuzakiense TaxID=53360 RepID=A0A9W6KCV5_9ACTN|nr:DUF6223 family protein [Dactylosporangium matsuzakiense]GLK98319.1 hypothetical protein GCM10017581_000600 [Dactylosporangium matsuzakiense]
MNGYLTLDRLVASVAMLVALAALIAGVLAMTRRARLGRRALMVITAGTAAGAVVGVVLLATADGGPGTGNGVVGAGAAVVFGLAAAVLAGLALRRVPAAD